MRFPYIGYKVTSKRQYTLVLGYRCILIITQTFNIYFSIHQYTFSYTLCIRVHLYVPFHAVKLYNDTEWNPGPVYVNELPLSQLLRIHQALLPPGAFK